ncbi:Lovastatin diketide synthase LovF [Madurella mycetomatis]|uniref:Lovastatin diketide synthase LovF n=1 Tax=Madurella mycetomatis TaxID=100816 RepID=A0A175VZ76_9PEZI|nr:Lovastatin diketide synthase LovF [Madurella mycetomatis]
MAKAHNQPQEPVAIVGFACRLPGGNDSPRKLWQFLERGEVASNKVPESRFNFGSHYDGSHKPGTMRPPGGMFLDYVDPADFDASFFEISGAEAVAMDPNQRQMLEVVFEGLENAGLTLERLNGSSVACFVGSFATDYGDIQNRDPLDRAPNHVIGIGRASMANRLSHFLNIKGPSVTLDTACSSSMVGLHLAARAIHNGEADAAIVATSNLYLNPEHVQDVGSLGQAHSPTGLCHTFDALADGYIKSEAVSAIILKRLSDAIRDRDPIRAVIRGTASTSNGRTNGIASPSAEAQAATIRQAYASAGIANLNDTAYLECHGTGTPAGDPTEVNGAGSVFAPTRAVDKPLVIGSIKSNLGHSEPAAGSSGIIKAVLCIENGLIPGTPSFINPNPKIDFTRNRVLVSRIPLPWPAAPGIIRRASVNSFGYGGSNAHAIIEEAPLNHVSTHMSSHLSADDFSFDFVPDDSSARPHTLVLSANDAASLKANVAALCRHLINPGVRVGLPDLAYTLSERRSRFWHRAFVTTTTTEIQASDFVVGKRSPNVPRVGFVFTGQGAQWPQMGRQLVEYFPSAREVLEELDEVLKGLPEPPEWTLVEELTRERTAEYLRQPEFSQPLVTALQLAILAVLEDWGVKAISVVGHSSGEIAAAYAAGLLRRSDAIKAAFYRGRAAVRRQEDAEREVGMLAVGLGAEAAAEYLQKYDGDVWIACFNSPSSLTISGRTKALEALAGDIRAAGHFSRLLQVDLAYHSELMDVIGEEYEELLTTDKGFSSADDPSPEVTMLSSVTAGKKTEPADALYWKTNMVSPVRFSEALTAMVSDSQRPDILIEIGPSGALAGPVSQVLKSVPAAADIAYFSSWSRGAEAAKALFNVAGRLFIAGSPIDFARVNEYDDKPKVITDLPNYSWNHSIKYWFEPQASIDWRFKPFVTHDLIGSKVLSSPWQAPTWRKRLNLADVPWLRDHAMGSDVLMPAAGYVAMALEAMYQIHCSLNSELSATALPCELAYRFRNVRFDRALVLEEGKLIPVVLSLSPVPGGAGWYEFRVMTALDDAIRQHCHGLVRVQDPVDEPLEGDGLAPLRYPTSAKLWYKAQNEIGMGFGPAFQKILSIEATSGRQNCRTRLSLEPPKSKWEPQSYYPIHPAVLDACFQSVTPALVAGERSKIKDIMIPAELDDILINRVPKVLREGLSMAESVFTERGRKDQLKSYFGNVNVYDPDTGALLVRVRGMHITKLDVGPRPDPHTFHRVSWKPDVSLLTRDQLLYLTPDQVGETKLDTIIDLVAHKKPTLNVLEVNLDGNDTSSLWFQGTDSSARAAYSGYHFASTDAQTLVTVQAQYELLSKTAFTLANPMKEALGLSTTVAYDFAVVKAPKNSNVAVDEVMANLRPLLAPDAFTLFVALGSQPPAQEVFAQPSLEGGFATPLEDDALLSSSPDSGTYPSTPNNESSGNTSDTSAGSVSPALKPSLPRHTWSRQILRRVGAHHFHSFVEVDSHIEGGTLTFLAQSAPDPSPDAEPWSLVVISLSRPGQSVVSPTLQNTLEGLGWHIKSGTSHLNPSSGRNTKTVVLMLDELFAPVLTQINGSQWDALKVLAGSGTPLLWVTTGSQHTHVTKPDRALVHGLFRVIRREDPTARLTVLDVQSATSPATVHAISTVLSVLQRCDDAAESEYAERDGVLYTQRIVPDQAVNDFKRAETVGTQAAVRGLHESEVLVRIHAERVGTMEMGWHEEETVEGELEEGTVEVEVRTVGVNFKDVATTMGIVPENEYTIGCECAGTVRRLGPGVTKFKVGDRVAVMSKGTYANRVRVPAGRAHVIPEWMSFEDAATIPLVYMTALYSLFWLGNLREGQSVLIHSAAGGVGLAAIQLARYKKAEIFVTVGTDEKREFLTKTFGIPPSHIFSSRDTKFVEQILRATSGRGVDIILNSLIGELLDASWRICADGGTMVEIGKRDIVDRNTLSMEPFDRNCSFRAIDLSYTKHFTPEVSARSVYCSFVRLFGSGCVLIGFRLFDEIFELVEQRHIGPIHPITTYGFDQVSTALAHIRRGQHIGKIVITDRGEPDVQLPIKPALRQLWLRPDVSYLIVGGLKGLCGSLAIHMAYHGARHIIACSRSGIDDEASARVVYNCHALGCEVTEARGDVSDADFVRGVFKSARPRIAGVIQGAMVLRDKPYEAMTVRDYHAAITAKVTGTWNLHNASQDLPAQKQLLDFFTMLSSISGVIGNKGQANYAAANTFLDAFASYRRSLGLAANTVDLGAIQDVGVIAETGSSLESRFDTRQWTPINETVLRSILSYSILQQDRRHPINPFSSAQLITGIAYPLQASSSDLADELRFRYLFGGGPDSSGADAGDGAKDEADAAARAFRMLVSAGADAATLTKAAVALLTAQVTKVLRLEIEVEPGKPLASYGLDSLSAVEIRGWGRTKLGAELSTLDITNANSIFALGEKIAAKVLAQPV